MHTGERLFFRLNSDTHVFKSIHKNKQTPNTGYHQEWWYNETKWAVLPIYGQMQITLEFKNWPTKTFFKKEKSPFATNECHSWIPLWRGFMCVCVWHTFKINSRKFCLYLVCVFVHKILFNICASHLLFVRPICMKQIYRSTSNCSF